MKQKRPKAEGKPVVDTDHLDVFSISQFCARHGISVATFYKFEKQMPETFSIGNRRLISRESAERWRREREAATA
jgi:hypothetical protein